MRQCGKAENLTRLALRGLYFGTEAETLMISGIRARSEGGSDPMCGNQTCPEKSREGLALRGSQ